MSINIMVATSDDLLMLAGPHRRIGTTDLNAFGARGGRKRTPNLSVTPPIAIAALVTLGSRRSQS